MPPTPPSGTGSAPSQREGCHLQHCEQLFLQHHGFPWTSPSEELIRSSLLKWKLGDSSMTEVGCILKLFGFFFFFFALQMQRYSLSNRFLAFISLAPYCCSVSISSSTVLAHRHYQNHCTILKTPEVTLECQTCFTSELLQRRFGPSLTLMPLIPFSLPSMGRINSNNVFSLRYEPLHAQHLISEKVLQVRCHFPVFNFTKPLLILTGDA